MSGNNISPRSLLHLGKDDVEDLEDDQGYFSFGYSSDIVSDALKNLYGFSGLLRGVKPVSGGVSVHGFVRTAVTGSDDWGTCIKAIYECEPGEILLVQCSDENFAVWGELASRAALNHGLAATVIVGSTRDTRAVIELGYPLFSSSVKSCAGKASNNGKISCDLFIGDMVVCTGDFIICDDDGVVVVSKDNFDEVLSEAESIKNFENECVHRMMDDDENLDDILGI